VEKWGRGISLILSKEPRTEFKEVGTHFITVFKRRVLKKTVEKTVEKIVLFMKENPKITIKELVEKTGLTRRGVEWNIAKLKEAGKIKRIGPAKGGHWEVKE